MASQKTCLVIDKSNLCRIQSKVPNGQEDAKGRSFKCYGILGIVNISGQNFLVAIASRNFVAKLSGNVNIYEVQQIYMHAFSRSSANLEMN